MEVTHAVMVVAALLLVFVLAKLNQAIKLLHNRLTLVSHSVRNLSRQVEEKVGALEKRAELEKQEQALQTLMDRDFKL